MTATARSAALKPYERSARRDIRIWLILLVGFAFAWVGSTIDPATNCSESGECAPWLVPIAKWVGIGALLISLSQLWVNPRRGSKLDPATGDLIWWQRRVGDKSGDEGRIHPSRIGRILIVRESEGNDGVHLYDLEDQRQPYFDSEVIPWPNERWAERLADEWPHIVVEVRG
jgi:hypothetical protein